MNYRPPRTPAVMVQAYRQAALTAPTVTGTASGHRCDLSRCRAVPLGRGAQFWICDECHATWETPATESPWWLVLGLALVLIGVALLFGAGYVTAVALRAWGFA